MRIGRAVEGEGRWEGMYTATTAGSGRAAVTSIDLIRAWAKGERTRHDSSAPSLMSSVKWPRPRSSLSSSTLCTLAPNQRVVTWSAPLLDAPLPDPLPFGERGRAQRHV